VLHQVGQVFRRELVQVQVLEQVQVLVQVVVEVVLFELAFQKLKRLKPLKMLIK
jgi:hypothetical protein